MTALPSGRPGRLLALLLLLLLLLAAWLGIAAPLLDWYGTRAERLDQRQALATRMERVAAGLPALRRAAEAGARNPAAPTLLDGGTDAVAAATLQERVQDMARTVGAPLSSAEVLPAVPAGTFRQVSLRVSLRAPWPAVVRLLQLIEEATPRMLVDELQLRSARLAAGGPDQPLETGFTVLAFRAGAP